MPPLLAAVFSEQVKEYVKQTSRLQENIKHLWALVWGQCSNTIQTRLQALDTYEDMHAASDGLRLLVAIKDLMYNVQEQKYVPLSIHLAKRQFFLLSQGRNTVGEYYEQFKNQTDVLDHIGAGIGDDDAITKQVLRSQGIDIEEATEAQEEAAEIQETEWYLALAFLMGSDRSRFGRLLEKLENDFTAGHDNYPKTLTDSYNMMTPSQSKCYKVRVLTSRRQRKPKRKPPRYREPNGISPWHFSWVLTEVVSGTC